jgi:hypothetical protein
MKNTHIYMLVKVFTVFAICCNSKTSIDRFFLMTRHNIENSLIDSLNSLSVGNRDFSFTVDITRFQTTVNPTFDPGLGFSNAD